MAAGVGAVTLIQNHYHILHMEVHGVNLEVGARRRLPPIYNRRVGWCTAFGGAGGLIMSQPFLHQAIKKGLGTWGPAK